ncbi:uncharacterized protein LOC103714043 [Phoenix dactylifera]|uniref:Uncharacterized protein LOC103714043 n=1 Tax=Phoenix dactylifera TaxID=42345 RepID=A0A8B7CHS7_PHODC|nr:uncharacterized protein LOC103714043 [Phoenix dactylifera]
MERRGEGMGPRQRWRRLKDRLRLKGVAWCGSPWARSRAADIHHRSPFDASTTASQEDAAAGAGPRYRREAAAAARNRRESDQDFGCILDQAPAGDAVAAIEEEEEEMNLAMALAAERDGTITPFTERLSLMRLMNEGGEERSKEEGGEGMAEGGEWWGCCVCMGRRKGAAFIPCGHTFCRVCARELWISRGSCPLCNQLILETLDIY